MFVYVSRLLGGNVCAQGPGSLPLRQSTAKKHATRIISRHQHSCQNLHSLTHPATNTLRQKTQGHTKTERGSFSPFPYVLNYSYKNHHAFSDSAPHSLSIYIFINIYNFQSCLSALLSRSVCSYVACSLSLCLSVAKQEYDCLCL